MNKRSDPSDQDRGVILVHVLSIITICSAVMATLLALQDTAIDQAESMINASRAKAIALGAETSAMIALRRDALEAPASDHSQEAWALVNEAGADFAGGRLRLDLSDDQGRFNLNNLLSDGVLAEDVAARLLAGVGAREPDRLAAELAALVRAQGGLQDLSELSALDIDPSLIGALAEVACVLPERTAVNLNSAPEAVLAAMLGNPGAARLLISRRETQGMLSPTDFVAAGVLTPPQAGFQSRYFTARIEVEMGGVRHGLTSHLRRGSFGDGPAVQVWRRETQTAARGSSPPSMSSVAKIRAPAADR
jgi:general secretion pathway protein K